MISANSHASAATFISRENINLTKSFNDDVYAAGSDLSIDSDINGDLFVAGGIVTIRGDIKGNLFAVGGNVTIDGSVKKSVKVGSGTLVINGTIGRDLMVGGGTITLNKNASIKGDVIAGSGAFAAHGPIGDDLLGGFGDLNLNGPVGGNVKVTVDELAVSSTGRIGGDLEYTSDNRAIKSPRAEIDGKTIRHIPKKPRPNPVGRFLGWLWWLASLLVIGVVLAWLIPSSLANVNKILSEQTWASLGIGFAAFFLVPIGIMMTMFTLIGIPLALILIGIYILLIYLAQIYTATALGSFILSRWSEGKRWIGFDAMIGIVLLSLVKLVPVAGPLALFAATLFGLGAIVIGGWRWRTAA